LLREYPHNAWGAITSWFDSRIHLGSWDIPAFQKQADFYQDYLMTHPMTTPGWANVFRTQQQVYDTLEKNYPKK
jgi:hypothetical protein